MESWKVFNAISAIFLLRTYTIVRIKSVLFAILYF